MEQEKTKIPSFEELIGQKFGRLLVTGIDNNYITPKGKHIKRLICKCDCGNITYVQKQNLLRGKARSCGCLQRELASANMKNRTGMNASKTVDLTGKKFGRLTAIKFSSRSSQGNIWECECECGNIVYVTAKHLTNGATKSCGCLRDEKISNVNYIHGKSHKSRLYNVWVGMRQRCNDPDHKSYENYGGRGIKVCEEWNDFETFEKWAIDAGYDKNAAYGDCTLDRIDVDGMYEPSNCRWTDSITQARNKRNINNN